MRRFVSFVFGALILVQGVHAAPVMFMDAAPDSTYTTWRSGALTDAADGSYVNMQHGALPGTTNTSPLDAIVDASLPHDGNRIQFVFFIPGLETTSDLAGKVEVRLLNDWDGEDYDWDGNPAALNMGWVAFTAGSGGKWQDNPGQGVTGVFGTRYFVSPPDYPTVADVADAIDQSQTYWRGELRIKDQAGPDGNVVFGPIGLTGAITEVPVPLAAPAGMALLAGIVVVRQRAA